MEGPTFNPPPPWGHPSKLRMAAARPRNGPSSRVNRHRASNRLASCGGLRGVGGGLQSWSGFETVRAAGPSPGLPRLPRTRNTGPGRHRWNIRGTGPLKGDASVTTVGAPGWVDAGTSSYGVAHHWRSARARTVPALCGGRSIRTAAAPDAGRWWSSGAPSL